MLDTIIDRVIDTALEEDLGAGDLTTESCVAEGAKAVAHAVARQDMVVCGGRVFARVFEKIDPKVVMTSHVADGTRVGPKTRLWTASGSARAILMAERTALNLVQRMCGVATMTRSYVDALPTGSKTRIVDTRKTTPGLRALERYGVRMGGGHNHRDNLGSAVLIKDNHIVAAGGVKQAILAARARAPHTSKVECEVDSLEQLDVALDAGADIVLLDNMSTSTIKEAVARTRGRALLEASGGITKERIRELAEVGVDIISSGALTHSVIACDIGLDFEG
jgi:nicotinate-nucleotide pyrophosphorylase (carboxylating)